MAPPKVTRDRDDIETWADEHDAVPVREGDRVRLVRETDVTESHERLDWDAFHRAVDEEDRVVTYYGGAGDRDPFEVGDRDAAFDRIAPESGEFDRTEAERRLRDGETVTGPDAGVGSDAGTEPAVETSTETGSPGDAGTEPETGADAGVRPDAETGVDAETDAEKLRTLPANEDEGKPVVYTSGNQIGEVIDVNEGAAFVDPHPSLAEKVMARLGVDEDEEYYRLHEDRIERITADEVVVSTGEFADDPVEDGG